MRSYLLKASDEEFDRWRAAADGMAIGSLAGFLRLAANELAARDPHAFDEPADGVYRRHVAGRELHPSVERSFRPDFKGKS
jgi:hypothetical protein